MAQSPPICGTLDETGDVGDDEFEVVLDPNDAEIGFERGEWIVSDLRLRRGDSRDECRLPDVGESDQRDIGHELEFEIQPLLLTHFALLGEGGGPADVGQEAGIALPTPTTGCRHPTVAVMHQIGQHHAIEIVDHGALGNVDDEIIGPGSMLLLPLTVGAALGPTVGMVLERQQRGDVAIGHEPDIAASATVATVRTTLGDMGFASKRHTAGAAIAAPNIQLAFVDESGHDPRAYGLGAPSPPMITATHRGVSTMGQDSSMNEHTPQPPSDPTAQARTPRQEEWIGTMHGSIAAEDLVLAHRSSAPPTIAASRITRAERELLESEVLTQGATAAIGAGSRLIPEEPDPFRTCFERDRDRILHSAAFRRLAGKTQVFVFPDDHQRTRLTHALEVAQVATAISRALGLNVALTEAIALGHDCGHGPGGHASEDAFDLFIPGGYHHAVWGADHVLTPLNLCVETLDGIRNHSWSRPTPQTPEGVVVSWADRCAYSAHDLEDAIGAGIVRPEDLPQEVVEVLGRSQREQLHSLISAVIDCAATTGVIGMDPIHASALSSLRSFNYERIYNRPESLEQGRAVVDVLTALVDHFISSPSSLPTPITDDPVTAAVSYVAGMTDRYAFDTATRLLGWPVEKRPKGIDLHE